MNGKGSMKASSFISLHHGRKLNGLSMKRSPDNIHCITDLMNALPGNSSVNTVQHTTIDEAVFFYVVSAEQ
jgi:hypothetical protein